MMRGVYVPHDLKSLKLSQDAERLLTNLVLDGRVSLELMSDIEADRDVVLNELDDAAAQVSPNDMLDPMATNPDLDSNLNPDFDSDSDSDSDQAALDMLALLENVTEAENGADETISFSDENVFAAPDLDVMFEASAQADANDADTEDALEESQLTSRLARVKQLFRRGRQAPEEADDDTLKTYIGLKNVRQAFERQTSKSPLGMTVLLVLCLMLVAAFPPIINLAYIQPNITKNNQKLSQIANFKAQVDAKKRDSAIQLNKIKKLEKNLGGYAVNVKGQAEFDLLSAAFLTALERYNVKILSNQTAIDETLTTKLADGKIIEGMVFDLGLQTRFDIYRNIRNIFMEQMGSVTVLEEKITAMPGSNELDIKLKMAVVYLKEGQ
ncbi:MAG: hypothetical protein ACON41_02025 [Parvibaculales bacterium]